VLLIRELNELADQTLLPGDEGLNFAAREAED